MAGSRINTNIAAYNALNALNNINQDLSVHQLRLSTGKRINSAADDASGYVISKKMDGTIKSLQAAVDNVGDAQVPLGVAEGGYQTIADILTQIKQDQTRANNGAFGTDEKNAIAGEVNQLMSEIDDINSQTQFNGTKLLSSDGSSSYSQDFQVGESSSQTMTIAFNTASGASSLLTVSAGSVTSANIGTLTVDTALTAINAAIGNIGAQLNRLTTKVANLNTAITNTQAAESRIMDADVASEQIASTKDQILQQTATAELAQANQSPQVFLSLFK